MDEKLFFSGVNFQIYRTPDPDPIIWDEPNITRLSEALITAPPTEKTYFFTKGFKGGRGTVPFPDFFLNPSRTFNPKDKTNSELFNIIETYQEDGQGLREFIGNLIRNGTLVKDSFSVLKCNGDGCDALTLGAHLRCNKCAKNLRDDARRELYRLPREVRELFYQRGKIIEGVIYHSIKSIQTETVNIGMNCILKEEGAEKGEIDVVVKNTDNGKFVVIHITISPRKDTECDQFARTLRLGINTIFITTAPSGASAILEQINGVHGGVGVIIWDIATDEHFFEKLRETINHFIL